MNVLDPFEVCEVQVWPRPQFEGRETADVEALAYFNALESQIFEQELKRSVFHAVLNEVEPRKPKKWVNIPISHRG